MLLHGYVIDILWTLFPSTSIRQYSCQNYATNDPIVIITSFFSIIKWLMFHQHLIYILEQYNSCVSFYLSDSRLKSRVYNSYRKRLVSLDIFWLVYKWQFGWACNWEQKRSFYQNMQACKRWIWDIQPNSITILDLQCGRRPCWSLFNKRISLTSFEFGTNMSAVPLSYNSQGIDCKSRMWTTTTWIWLPEPETTE